MKRTGLMEIGFTNGVVVADAKTGMVNLNSLVVVGNMYSGTDRRLDNWLRLDSTKEFIDIVKSKYLESEVIKTTRGRYNGGTWANIHIAIDLAMWLNPEFKYEVIDTFVNKKILDLRLLGLDSFKKLNDKVKDMLGDRAGSYHYIRVAEAVNKRVNGEFIKGWDNVNADADKQALRTRVIDFTCSAIDMGFVNSFEGLINAIENYKG